MAKNKFDIVGLLEEHGAVLNGHFQLPSGFHSQTYIQTSLVLQYPHLANKIAREMADKFPQDIDLTISSSPASLAIGQEVARIKKARSIFPERANGVMLLKRDFKINEGEKVLVVDDVFNTGKLCSEAIALARNYRAKVIGVAAIVDRSDGESPINVPIRALISYPLQLFSPDECPLCKQNIPLTHIGGQGR